MEELLAYTSSHVYLIRFLLALNFVFIKTKMFNPLSECCTHVETSPLTCTANQLTGFYTRERLALNGLSFCLSYLLLNNYWVT